MSRKGGVLSGGFQPLKAPNAPTIDSVSAGVLSADVTVSAPANTGDGTVSGYVVTAKQSDGSLATGTSSTAGAVSVPLTASGTTEFATQAFSEYGPGQFSGFGNSTTIPSGQELYTWGAGFTGRLGLNNTINVSSPVQVGALTTWSQASSGQMHTAAIKTDGTLWTWGSGQFGKLGANNTIYRSSPVQVGALTNWAEVSAGDFHTAAIKTDGTLWTWGYSTFGQLGQNNVYGVNVSSPVQVGALTTWYKVSAGGYITAAIKTDGSLWTTGSGSNGETGLNTNVRRSSPVQVGALTNWYLVSAGTFSTAAVKTDGTFWAWGYNGNFGQAGQGSTTPNNFSSPVQVGTLTNWAKPIAARYVTSGVKTDGTLWTWGRAYQGMLGHNDAISRSSPVQVGADTDWAQAVAGTAHMASIKTDGTLWTWGVGSRLGHNDTISRSSPVQVGSLTTWSQVSASGRSSFTAAIQQSFT